MTHFEKAREKISDYVEDIQKLYDLSDEEMKDILDIVSEDY